MPSKKFVKIATANKTKSDIRNKLDERKITFIKKVYLFKIVWLIFHIKWFVCLSTNGNVKIKRYNDDKITGL